MTAIPVHDPIGQAIDASYERRREFPRQHLGCSVLGHKCDRYIWLQFRWAVRESFSGRMLRLFERGQHEEARMVRWLTLAGIIVTNTGEDQSHVELGPHVSGSVDGIAENVPQAPKKKHVVEIKTHNAKSFAQLKKEGVQAAKPMHWAQMQLYMLGLGIDRALYCAVCKDDDALYFERVRFDKQAAEDLAARGRRLALAERMPDPISTNPTWYECKMCPAWDLCHGAKITREVNCRTCAHSTPTDQGVWRCEAFQAEPIPAAHQRTGCDEHVLHPDLTPWELDRESSTTQTAVFIIDGERVANGPGDEKVFDSHELIARALKNA